MGKSTFADIIAEAKTKTYPTEQPKALNATELDERKGKAVWVQLCKFPEIGYWGVVAEGIIAHSIDMENGKFLYYKGIGSDTGPKGGGFGRSWNAFDYPPKQEE